MAFVHCSAVPNIVRDITGVAKLITEIWSDLNIFLAGSLFIGEHQAKRIRRCWRKLHHGSPTISVWGCPMGSAAWLRAERSTCGTRRGCTFFDRLTLNHAAPLKVWSVVMMACCVYWLAIARVWPTVWLWPQPEIYDCYRKWGLFLGASVPPTSWTF